jgi:Na+-driven multidrug efflux pump
MPTTVGMCAHRTLAASTSTSTPASTARYAGVRSLAPRGRWGARDDARSKTRAFELSGRGERSGVGWLRKSDWQTRSGADAQSGRGTLAHRRAVVAVEWESSDENGDGASVGAVEAREGRLPSLDAATFRSLALALVTLGAPALLNSVNEPVVSLLETVLVARVGTLFLAALAPASALFGLVEEVCFAFSVVVTTAVSRAYGEMEDEEDNSKARAHIEEVVSTSAFASFLSGIVLAVVLQLFYGPICRVMVVPQEVEALLRMYTILRCIGLPVFGAANALEGAFLGNKDAWTPMIGWLLSGIITAALQLIFIQPAMTAHNAVLSAGLALTIGQVFIFGYLWNIAAKSKFFSLGAIFRGAQGVVSAVKLSYTRLQEMRIVSEFAWLVINAAARMTTYVIITTCATQLGVVPAAVNKTLLDLYILLGLCAEPVFTVGNVLLPRKVRKSQADALMHRRALFYIAVFMGSTLACAAYFICGSGVLTHDPQLDTMVHEMKGLVAVTIGLSTTAYATDGCVIGLNGAHFVGVAQIVNTIVFIAVYFTMASVYGASTSLAHVWTALLVFQSLRIVEHVVKLVYDERRFFRQA